MYTIELSENDLQLLLQSLEHCLATCREKSALGPDAPCTDCVAARELRGRLRALDPTLEVTA